MDHALQSAGAPATPADRTLNILITMCFLVHRTGAELFTRDIALWLGRRGHAVTVFGTAFADMADELRKASIACITDLSDMAMRPDVIIGNTHHETVRSLLHFPDVPALSICHDRSADHGRPIQLGQVVQHIAVDENCAERLVHEFGFPRDSVMLVPNGVDLQRFKRRGPLPGKPSRALVFSNYALHGAALEEIRLACEAQGIALDVVGAGIGNQAAEPAELLGHYDIVFGKARCAVEALATGCAVIVLDESQGMGAMITRASVEHDRLWNFGRRLMSPPITRERVAQQLSRYDASDASAVTDWARQHAGLDATGLPLEQLALQAVRAHSIVNLEPQQRLDELAHYMDDWLKRSNMLGTHAMIAQLHDRLRNFDHSRAEQTSHLLARIAQLDEAVRNQEPLARAQSELQAVLNSRSWRMTLPLRWMAGLARTVRNKRHPGL
ncbi:MAG: glycosyltransferase [Pseudomonadota bacterium]